MKSSPVRINRWSIDGTLLSDQAPELQEALRKRAEFLAERKRRNDAEFEAALREKRIAQEKARVAREAERYRLSQQKKQAARYRRLAGVGCGIELTYDALGFVSPRGLSAMDYPWVLDNIHTTRDYVERWLKDEGVDISD